MEATATPATRADQVDVCILGAGMAGLTLARQLLRRDPSLSIILLEHRQFPMPQAAHKVGESTVEIAAHYLAEQLDLKAHLRAEHLPKFGLRLFLRGDDPIAKDLAHYDELGVSEVLPIPTFQIDRGRLENHLATEVVGQGAEVRHGATVRKVDIDPGRHQVHVRCADQQSTIQARYLVDASGRRGWLRNQCQLARKARHANHAVWFRTDANFELDAWSDNAEWQGRCCGTARRLSTNHFTGPGYWLWLIPLASDCTSVGLVFDPAMVPTSEVNQHDKLLRWLSREHPLVAAQLVGHPPMDFHVLKDYAVGCKQVFSDQSWMLSGDAGVFADPFYSPGADFIAFANGYITELITGNGEAERWQQFQRYYLSFFSNTLSLYRGQYGGFGDRNLMVMKTLWDYTYYWGPLSQLFFSGRYLDTDFMEAQQPALLEAATLNSGMQSKFRTLATRQQRVGGQGRFFNHHKIPLFHRMKQALLCGASEEAGTQLCDAVETLRFLSADLQTLLQQLDEGADMPPLEEIGQWSVFA